MPIYAYKCAACGHTQDVLQKISDAPLTACPACGAAAFAKQVTAAGFQLKGSGWYVTDFRDNGGGKKMPADDKPADGAAAPAAKPDSAPAAEGGASGDAKPAESKPAVSKSPAPAPAPSSGGG